MKAASRNGNSRRERVQGACHHGKCCAAGGKCVRSGMGQRKPMGVSGGCATGCAVQGGEEAGCEEGALRAERAATAEERAVCMACCSGAAPDPRAATSRDDGGQTIGFRRTARRRLRRAVHEEPSDGSRMRWSSMRGSSMRCGRDLRSSSVVQCGGVAMAVGSAPREARRGVPRQLRQLPSSGFVLFT